MKSDKVKLPIKGWIGTVYVLLSVILVPWTIYLGATLPRHHLSAHWDVSWTGLDIALVLTILATGILAYTRSKWIIIVSSTVGSLLLVDVWFDVISERRGLLLRESIILAIFIELPLSFTSYYIAYKALESRTK